MIRYDDLLLMTRSDLDETPDPPWPDDVGLVWCWLSAFLCAPHPELGRRGPVCPYTRAALDQDLLYLARPDTRGLDERGLADLVRRFRHAYQARRDAVCPERRHLVSLVVLLPATDRVDPGPLDRVQATLKTEFVRQGLMIGQFHPLCDAPGLWSPDFRPLRSPVPLLAMREMAASDLPFLVGDQDHLTAYFDRFGPELPMQTRRFLVERLIDR